MVELLALGGMWQCQMKLGCKGDYHFISSNSSGDMPKRDVENDDYTIAGG